MAEIDRDRGIAVVQTAAVAELAVAVQTPAGRCSAGVDHTGVITARRQRHCVGDVGNGKRHAEIDAEGEGAELALLVVAPALDLAAGEERAGVKAARGDRHRVHDTERRAHGERVIAVAQLAVVVAPPAHHVAGERPQIAGVIGAGGHDPMIGTEIGDHARAGRQRHRAGDARAAAGAAPAGEHQVRVGCCPQGDRPANSAQRLRTIGVASEADEPQVGARHAAAAGAAEKDRQRARQIGPELTGPPNFGCARLGLALRTANVIVRATNRHPRHAPRCTRMSHSFQGDEDIGDDRRRHERDDRAATARARHSRCAAFKMRDMV